jgi:hypothetical protein
MIPRLALIHVHMKYKSLDDLPEIYVDGPEEDHQIADEVPHEPGGFVFLTTDNGYHVKRYLLIEAEEVYRIDEHGWYRIKAAFMPHPVNLAIEKGNLEVTEIFNGYALYGKNLMGEKTFIAHMGDGVDFEFVNYDPNGDPDLEEAYQFKTFEVSHEAN